MADYPLLQKAFDPESFRLKGHELIDRLSDLIISTQKGNGKVTETHNPDQLLAYWRDHQTTSESLNHLYSLIIDQSIKLHHPKFIGHQISSPVPISTLSNLLSSFLNNGMGIYEMGEGATALEKVVAEFFCEHIGYADGDGLLTSGGTLANLTALLCARAHVKDENIWKDGSSQRYAIMVSEMAHYCVDRAVRIMGWGDAGIIKVPVDKDFKMNTDLLESIYQKHTAQGICVIGVVGSAPCTATGSYDDLNAIADFCEAQDLWFHIDGAHGGPAIFSPKYKYLMDGAQRADSIVIDAHKMMLTPALATALLFKEALASYKTFSQKADYLWEAQEEAEWHNLAKRTFECTKYMMSLKIYSIIQEHGVEVFDQFLTRQYDLARSFAFYIKSLEDFELATDPDANIVCFRYMPESGIDPSHLNRRIRHEMLEDGSFYIVQTELQKGLFLRTTIMNAFTTMDHLKELIKRIRAVALSLAMPSESN